jgi:hypothetical protein
MDDDDGFGIVLLASPGFVILVGLVIGIQLHTWRSLLMFAAAWTTFIPVLPYSRYRDRLPKSRVVLRPVQTAVYILTLGMPLTIWILLLGPGVLGHEVLTFLGCMVSRATCRAV